MKKTRVDKEIDGAIELFESSHYVVPFYDSETGGTGYTSSTAPAFSSIRKLKRKRPDYRTSPVKIYTREEIDEYIKSKTLP